jgi:hypothetical protein
MAMSQPEDHAEKYKSFLEALTVYLNRKPAPRKKRKGMEFDPLLIWRDQPSGEPLASTFKTVANDNVPSSAEADEEEKSYATEMIREIVPGGNNIEIDGEIMASVEKAEYRDVPAFALIPRDRVAPARRTEPYPTGGDVEYGTHVDGDGERHRVVTRIGKLRFSNGTQTEKATMRVDGKVVEKSIRMPVGAMLGTRERLRKEKGGEQVWGASNKVWIDILDGKPQRPQKIASGPVRRGKSYTAAESRAMLAEAVANTPVVPEVTVCPPGLPHKPERIADAFLAGKKTTCSGGGSMSWQITFGALTQAKEWKKACAEMLAEDVAVLDAALTAQNYGDIGAVVGKSRKAGRRLLKAANDNLAKVIEKYVA